MGRLKCCCVPWLTVALISEGCNGRQADWCDWTVGCARAGKSAALFAYAIKVRVQGVICCSGLQFGQEASVQLLRRELVGYACRSQRCAENEQVAEHVQPGKCGGRKESGTNLRVRQELGEASRLGPSRSGQTLDRYSKLTAPLLTHHT